MKTFFVVSYDIGDDRRRRKVMKTMEDFGARVQYSVFECWLEPAQVTQLRNRLRPFVRAPEDSIRFYPLCGEDVPRILVMGSGSVKVDHVFFLI